MNVYVCANLLTPEATFTPNTLLPLGLLLSLHCGSANTLLNLLICLCCYSGQGGVTKGGWVSETRNTYHSRPTHCTGWRLVFLWKGVRVCVSVLRRPILDMCDDRLNVVASVNQG